MEEQLKSIIKEAVREVLSELENKAPKEVLTPKELAEWLGVSQSWISVNKDKLNIPYFEAGGIKFYRSDIELWIEEQKQEVKDNRPVYHSLNMTVAKKKLKIS